MKHAPHSHCRPRTKPAQRGDARGARERLTKLRSIYPEFTPARLLQFLFDWRTKTASTEAAPLLALDWRSSDEFYGYLARVLTGEVALPEALNLKRAVEPQKNPSSPKFAPSPDKSQTGVLGAALGLGRGWKAGKRARFAK